MHVTCACTCTKYMWSQGGGWVPGRWHLPVISHTRKPSTRDGCAHHHWPVPVQDKVRCVRLPSHAEGPLVPLKGMEGDHAVSLYSDCTSSTSLGSSARGRRGNCSRPLWPGTLRARIRVRARVRDRVRVRVLVLVRVRVGEGVRGLQSRGQGRGQGQNQS